MRNQVRLIEMMKLLTAITAQQDVRHTRTYRQDLAGSAGGVVEAHLGPVGQQNHDGRPPQD